MPSLGFALNGFLALLVAGAFTAMWLHEKVAVRAERAAAVVAVNAERAANETQCKAAMDVIVATINEKALDDARAAWAAEQAVTPTPKERPAIDALCASDVGCREHGKVAKR
jgi:hypothetical protein